MHDGKLLLMEDSVSSDRELADYLIALRDDFLSTDDNWENVNTKMYLEAMAAWVNDMHGLTLNLGTEIPDQPTWQWIARIFTSPKYYE